MRLDWQKQVPTLSAHRVQLESGSAIEKEITTLNRKFKPYKIDLGDRKSLYDFINTVKNETVLLMSS
jgi:hypothetical protein